MKKTNLRRDAIHDYFQAVKGTIGTVHSDIDKIFVKAGEARKTNHVDRYEPEYRRQWLADQRQRVFAEVEAIRAVGDSEIDSYFGLIRAELNDWVRQPITPELGAMLDTFHKYGLSNPSVLELEALQESAAGSYLGSKIVDGMARSVGVFNTGFVQIESIMQALSTAQKDCHTAIDHYIGKMDSARRYPGQEFIPVPEEKLMLCPYAENFTEMSTSFSRIAEELSSLTTDSFDILPSKRKEIDKLFEGATSEQRTAIAKSLIETNDKYGALLPKYDSGLYQAALDAISDERQEAARQAMADLEAARVTASSAVQASVKADAKARHMI